MKKYFFFISLVSLLISCKEETKNTVNKEQDKNLEMAAEMIDDMNVKIHPLNNSITNDSISVIINCF